MIERQHVRGEKRRPAEVDRVDEVNRREKVVRARVDDQLEMVIARAVQGNVVPVAIVETSFRLNLMDFIFVFVRRGDEND